MFGWAVTYFGRSVRETKRGNACESHNLLAEREKLGFQGEKWKDPPVRRIQGKSHPRGQFLQSDIERKVPKAKNKKEVVWGTKGGVVKTSVKEGEGGDKKRMVGPLVRKAGGGPRGADAKTRGGW